MEPTGIHDSRTGEQMSSVLFEHPVQVPEHEIIKLLPLKALGYSKTLEAVDAVKKIIRQEGLDVRAAVVKAVISFGVTDQSVLDEITNPPKPKLPSAPTASSSRTQPANVSEGYIPPHQRWKQQERGTGTAYIPPHLRQKQQAGEKKPKEGENGGEEKK